jgi:ComF family protein
MQREDMLPLNAPIYSLKRHNRDDVLEFCTNELSEAIRNCYPNASEFIFTNIPRSEKSIVKYGFDHAEMLAKSLAEKFGARYEKLLVSNVKTEQKKLHGESRKINAKFSLIEDLDLSGQTVLIIDDIVTTGSSMGAAAMLIHGLGARKIFGATLGIAFKDKYTPFPRENSYYVSY